jgi:hypothetical protein
MTIEITYGTASDLLTIGSSFSGIGFSGTRSSWT